MFVCIVLKIEQSPDVRLNRRKSGWPSAEFLKVPKDSRRNRYGQAGLCLATGNGGGVNQGLYGVGDGDGVIIVDHGSRRMESNLMLSEFILRNSHFSIMNFISFLTLIHIFQINLWRCFERKPNTQL